jgi:hypothetical protein
MSEISIWPKPISDAGMYGIPGEFVRLVEADTEGDRNIILLTFLVYAGNFLGREYYVRTGADRQCANLYLCVVGGTSGGRKGSAISAAESFFTQGSNPPKLPKIVYGVSSGEGVIHQVRDAKTKRELNKKTKQFEDIILDEGVTDKRVLFNLSEFQQYIAAMRRQESILASIIRQAWDKGMIASPSKNNEVISTNAYISMVAATSKEELLVEVTATDAHNGTLNRIMFACAQRSRLLPEGGEFDELYNSDKWKELQRRFHENVKNATGGASLRVERESDTQDDWGRNDFTGRGLYYTLSRPRIGQWGTITARAPQQVIRLSLIFAIINGHSRIQTTDQDAAVECWRFCDDSTKYIFGDRVEDARAVQILTTLRELPNGLTRSQMGEMWRGKDLDESLGWLAKVGLIYRHEERTSGRPAERWFASL